MSKNVHKHYYKHLASKKDRKRSWVFPREIIGSSDWLASLWEQRSNIDDIPKIMVWGMKDPAFQQNELDVWVKNWDNVRVVKLDDVGHFPQEEAPE